MKNLLKIIALVAVVGTFGCTSVKVDATKSNTLTAMAWNIWHGGREDGEIVGPKRVVEVIQESGTDIVAMQETYGSGEIISEALGFHFHPRGTNVSIHSRYPILEDVSVFQEFKCVGAIIELPDNTPVAFYSIWLPYSEDIHVKGSRDGKTKEQLLAACDVSRIDLQEILALVQKRLAETSHDEISIIIAGDYNSMSHLDYTEENKEQFGYVIDWPTSRVITEAGYVDAYRAVHPEVNRTNDRTWTPRFPEQFQDRIDFIYCKSNRLRVVDAEVIDLHKEKFPSDHAAVIATYVY